MAQIIKLTTKKRCTIQSGSAPDVPVIEEVTIPPNHYGELYIRKRLGNCGLNVPNSIFHEKWTGIPEICLINSGANDIELLAGEEIGELHIRYSPPSPVKGSWIQLPNTFAVSKTDNGFQVITEDSKVYKCKNVYQMEVTGNVCLDIPDEGFSICETTPFNLKFIMEDYEFIRHLDTNEAARYNKLLLDQRLTNGLVNMQAMLEENNIACQKILGATQDFIREGKVKSEEVVDEPNPHDHVYVKDESTPLSVKVSSLTLNGPFRITNDGKLITAWLGNKPFATAEEYVIGFESWSNGFVYGANELPSVTTPTIFNEITAGHGFLPSLINPTICLVNGDDIELPKLELIDKYGQVGALVYQNLGRIMGNVSNMSCVNKNFLAFVIKALIKEQHRKKWDVDSELPAALRLLRTITNKRSLTHVLKEADNSWNRPLRAISLLANEFPEILADILMMEN